MNLLQQLTNSESGATVIEYMLILGLGLILFSFISVTGFILLPLI